MHTLTSEQYADNFADIKNSPSMLYTLRARHVFLPVYCLRLLRGVRLLWTASGAVGLTSHVTEHVT